MLADKLRAAAVSQEPAYIEDVFSTYLYTGNGSTQTITNGIDLAGEGGLTFVMNRGGGVNWIWADTARGVNKYISSNSTAAEGSSSSYINAFNSDGFTGGVNVNSSGANYASWTLREQPKFFAVVTYTGNGAASRSISHSLGAVPGFIIVKATSATGDWAVWHRSTAVLQGYLNTAAAFSGVVQNFASQTSSTTFGIYGPAFGGIVNDTGVTYVAYLFAHDAGGFGLTGTDNVISCGSFTSIGSALSVNLGYEPKWLLFKPASAAGSWELVDNMRGFQVDRSGETVGLEPNLSAAEAALGLVGPTATGFTFDNGGSGDTYIYIAIRRGPMKVPTIGTSVFAPVTATPSGATTVTTNFPVDLAINAQRDSATSGNKVFWDRLRGSSTAAGQGLFSNLTNAEVSYSGNGIGLQSNTTIVDNFWNTLNGATTPVIYWNFRRAPGFFDEVCYTGDNTSNRVLNHNLGVAPEMMIFKRRGPAGTNNSWLVYHAGMSAPNNDYISLNSNSAKSSVSGTWGTPTTSTFTLGIPFTGSNGASPQTYVAYLFASCPGVSKVGSYTGTGTTQQIDCGFTAGARFVLIKRTDAAGDWYVWDTVRGIIAGNDPYLLLNSTAAEVTSTDYIDAYSAGFEISSTAPAKINASGGTFIFLAIA